MGASRKLQGEIDRVLKKPEEVVDVFDGIWNKVPPPLPLLPHPRFSGFCTTSHDSPGSRRGLEHRECKLEGEVRGGPQAIAVRYVENELLKKN